MSNGCFGGFCGGLYRRVRGAFRSIRARLVRRNLRHVDGERQGGTPNTSRCPDDGLPSSKQPVRHEQFIFRENDGRHQCTREQEDN
uniref:Uncharacterized protein n=1 Tax=Timema poppense TaxID=170557 RepID=A0A7R9HDN4_TIMPO|nr:unnamed protein product [Timema poppensis]